MDIFERGYSMDFVRRSKFLLSLFFTEIMSEKIVFDIYERNNDFKRKKVFSYLCLIRKLY